MANINYTKVSWDTTKSLGPTNLNHMDDGIKSVCDKMDNIGDEVMGYEVTSTGPSHQIINATNATNATNDGTGMNIANQFTELSNKITSKAQFKIVWTNSNPSVAFGQQTVQLTNATDCSAFGIIFRINKSSDNVTPSGLFTAGSQARCCYSYALNLGRNLIVNSSKTSATIYDSYYYATYGSSTIAYNNDNLIPYIIYGI